MKGSFCKRKLIEMSKILSFVRSALKIILPPAVSAAVITIGASYFLRYLYVFIGAETKFGVIFSQIRDAEMSLPVLRIFLICMLSRLVGRYLWQKHKKIRFLLVLAGGLIFLTAFVTSVLLTKVNGIGFGGVLFSLIRLLRAAGDTGLL